MILATPEMRKMTWMQSYTALEGKTSEGGFERVGMVAQNDACAVRFAHRKRLGSRWSVHAEARDDGVFWSIQWRELTDKG